MAWIIEYTQTAASQIGKLDQQIARRILDYMDDKIASLDDPRMRGKALTGPLGELWRYRIGNYRVVCAIQDNLLRILVVEAGHRKQVYRQK